MLNLRLSFLLNRISDAETTAQSKLDGLLQAWHTTSGKNESQALQIEYICRKDNT